MENINLIQLIIGNLFGALCGIFCICSTFAKDKKRIMGLQSCDCFCGLMSCVILQGYSGAVTQGVSLARNYCLYKQKMTKKLQILFIVLMLVVGLLTNNRGLFGLLPIIASVTYTVAVLKVENATLIKLALAFNNILWIIYDFILMNYFSVFFSSLIVISSIFNSFKASMIKNTKNAEI